MAMLLSRNNAICSLDRLLLTLRFFATGMFHIAVADFAGVSKTSAAVIATLVTKALAAQRSHYVKFPSTRDDIKHGKRLFYEKAKFPNVIGAIDCTHVKILSTGRCMQVY